MRVLLALLCICLAFAAAAPLRAKGPLGDSISCSICNWAVGEIESLLAANQTEQAIIGLLLGDCSIFGPFQDTCQLFINNTVPQLINLLEQNYPPNQVCSMVDLCPAASTTGNSNSGNNNAATNSNSRSATTNANSASASASAAASASSGGKTHSSSGKGSSSAAAASSSATASSAASNSASSGAQGASRRHL